MQGSGTGKKMACINAGITMTTQMIQVLLGFVVRRMLIDSLGIAYLGYNSVFANVLQMLNLVDLGIGIAITSFLYEPLAQKDEMRVSTLMYIYKRLYRMIGTMVAVLGLVVTLFVPLLIPDAACGDSYLRILFLIHLAGAVSTYFLAYKRTLLIVDQMTYVATIVDTFFFVVATGMQILVLYFAPNYIVYLVINVLKNVVSNLTLSVLCDKKKQEYLGNKDTELVKEYKEPIRRYVKDLFISRIGSYIYYSTDNIIISVFRGSLLAGFLSNYTMVVNLVQNLLIQILSSLQATYGHYIATSREKEKQKEMTDHYFFMNFVMGTVCMVCLLLLTQPFISLCFGREYLLAESTLVLLGVNFFLTILIQIPSQVFVVFKLYHYDYPIIITSALLNILISVGLVGRMGIDGVLIGTFATSLIYLFSRFYIIAKYAFGCRYRNYLFKISLYFGAAFCTVGVTKVLTDRVVAEGWSGLFGKAVLVAGVAVLTMALFLSWTREWKFLCDKFKVGKVMERRKRRK